jgi:hypothetical protein
MTGETTEEKVLMIIKGDNGFEFFFDDMDDGRIWIVQPDFFDKKYVAIFVKKDIYIINYISKKYKELGVTNLCELYEKFTQRPEEVIENLIGERPRISRVIIKNFSELNKNGFMSCNHENTRKGVKRREKERKV